MRMTLRRLPNREYRSREHLTPIEAYQLIDAAGLRGRHPVRDQGPSPLTLDVPPRPQGR
jgi:hypothetical protein